MSKYQQGIQRLLYPEYYSKWAEKLVRPSIPKGFFFINFHILFEISA
jgi:hypothetical protein